MHLCGFTAIPGLLWSLIPWLPWLLFIFTVACSPGSNLKHCTDLSPPQSSTESSSLHFPQTPWTVACQVPLSMEFSRPEYWGGLPFPCPGDLPNPAIKPKSPALQADSSLSEPPGKPQLSSDMCKNHLLQSSDCFRAQDPSHRSFTADQWPW